MVDSLVTIGEDDENLKNRIQSRRLKHALPYSLSKTCRRLIKSCFSADPARRPTASSLLLSDWFSETSINQLPPQPAENVTE